jgi:hypothetical protein
VPDFQDAPRAKEASMPDDDIRTELIELIAVDF